MARGANIRGQGARKAFNKVAGTRGGLRCGRSRRGAKREVCLAVAPVVGWKCGRNPINGLYACVNTGGRAKGKKRGKRR